MRPTVFFLRVNGYTFQTVRGHDREARAQRAFTDLSTEPGLVELSAGYGFALSFYERVIDSRDNRRK